MQDKLERFQEEIKRGDQKCPLALDANGLEKKREGNDRSIILFMAWVPLEWQLLCKYDMLRITLNSEHAYSLPDSDCFQYVLRAVNTLLDPAK